MYKPIPACSCNAAIEYEKDREEEKVHQFVMGLDEARFGVVCQGIIASDSLIDLGDAYAKIVREEERLNSTKEREIQQNAVGFTTKKETVDSSNTSQTRRSTQCSHCGRSGHEKSYCWQLVGFPNWWEERSTNRGENRAPRGRGRGGSNRTSSARVNNVQATTSNSSLFLVFTEENLRALTQMINEKTKSSDKLSGKKRHGDLILDTGASHYMAGDVSLLEDVKIIPPCLVGFADGNRTYATHVGIFILTTKITLSNVLYVPNLNFSLISMSKLLHQTNCFARLTDIICVLQDRFTRMLIGAGEERDGVYFFKDVMAARVSVSDKFVRSVDHDRWHQRLGHPSFSVLSSLKLCSLSNKYVSPLPCDTCFRAKQTREVFCDSSNKTRDFFELIHCDVWGPYRTKASSGAVYFLTIVDDYSRSVWTYLLLEKSEVCMVLQNFVKMALKQFTKEVKMVRSDNGTEFMCLSSYFRENGILNQNSCVAIP